MQIFYSALKFFWVNMKYSPMGSNPTKPHTNSASFIQPCAATLASRKKERQIIPKIVNTMFCCNAQGQRTHFTQTEMWFNSCPTTVNLNSLRIIAEAMERAC